MKYDYIKIYNEYWQEFMDNCDIEVIGIIRKDKDKNKLWGFTNVYSDDDSPYDFCARIGYAVLSNLQEKDVDSIEIVNGQYMLGKKTEHE
jgi:hypothetical protein